MNRPAPRVYLGHRNALRACTALLAFLCVVIWPPTASANGACRQLSQVCVDGPSTRNINGLNVTRDCWQYAEQWECVDAAAVDYCAPIAASPGCSQLMSQCAQTAFDGSCLFFSNQWRCPDPLSPEPPNVERLPDTHTLVRDVLDDSQCRLFANTPGCALLEARTCVEGPETRVINGMAITKACWAWAETWVCTDTGQTVSDCGPLEDNPLCTLQSESCIDTNTYTGQCSFVTRVYRCEDQGPLTREVTTCGSVTCIGGFCESGDDPADQDFGRSVTALEIARQVGVYGDLDNDLFFRGSDDRCSRKLFGLANCCRAKVQAGTGNSSFSIYADFGYQAGREAIRFMGSTYMHDILFRQSWVTDAMYNALYGNSFGSSFASNFNFYGVTWNSAVGFGFDPYTFAIAVAIQMLMQYLQCEQHEQVLALKKGQALCRYVGTYCHRRTILGGCLERRDSHCCFNSKLARIIHEQARPQLGRGWGAANAPDCGGLTLAEIQAIDFSAIDFSEFIRDIAGRAVDSSAVTARAQQRTQQIINAPPGSYFPMPGPTGVCRTPPC